MQLRRCGVFYASNKLREFRSKNHCGKTQSHWSRKPQYVYIKIWCESEHTAKMTAKVKF